MTLRCIVATALITLQLAAAASAAVLFGDVPVSNSGTSNSIAYPNTSRKVTAGPNGTVYVVYYNPSGVWVARSTNRGQSFLTPVQVGTSSAEAEIASDANGIVYVAWVQSSQATFSRSTDSGVSFSVPASIGAASGTVHMAVDAPHVYIVTKDGTTLFRNSDSGAGTFDTTTVDSSRVFADVHVDPHAGDVYVQTDDPTVRVFKSTDHGATFTGPNAPGGSIYYSTTVLASTGSGVFLYTSGNGSTALRTKVSDYSAATLTFGTTTISQGRTLAVDAFSNVIDGYVDGSAVKYAISTDNGESFDTAVTIATASYLSLALNRRYGDIVAVYEQNGQIFCTVYGGEIVQAPTVDTAAVGNITSTSAACGGDVVVDGGAPVTARGVCWNTTGSPTTSDSTTTDGDGTGAFTSSLTGLSSGTTYYVRAYATNSAGTAYGSQLTFAAASVDPGAPDLRVTIEPRTEANGGTVTTGQLLSVDVNVENVGDAGATGVRVLLPLPDNMEFVSATVLGVESALMLPAQITMEGNIVIIDVGDLPAGDQSQVELVLRAKASGSASFSAQALSEETPDGVDAASSEVIVEDEYYVFLTPFSLCGALGLLPLFALTAALGMIRRGRR